MNVSKTCIRGGGAKCSWVVTGEGYKSWAKTGRKWILHLSSQHLMSTHCVPGIVQGMNIKCEGEQNHVQSCHRQSEPWEQQQGGGCVRLGFSPVLYDDAYLITLWVLLTLRADVVEKVVYFLPPCPPILSSSNWYSSLFCLCLWAERWTQGWNP